MDISKCCYSNDDDVSLVKIMADAFPRSRFFDTYCRKQSFSFPPDSIIYYITKNPSSTKVYQKLIQSCKHFFVQNPILVVYKLYVIYFYSNRINYHFNDQWIEDFNKISSKIWVTDVLMVENNSFFHDVHDHFSKNIIQQIYQCDVKQLTLDCQIITFKDFLFLAPKCTYIDLAEVNVNTEDGVAVALEKLFESLPEVKEFRCYLPKNPSNIITSKTAKELIKIPHFANLESINLSELPEIFDIDSFYAYIKINKTPCMIFNFNDSISEEFKSHLEKIGDEIIHANNLPNFWIGSSMD